MPAETLWIRDLDLPDDVILLYKGIRGVVPAAVWCVRTYAEYNACGDSHVTVKETRCPASHSRRKSRVCCIGFWVSGEIRILA